MKSNSPSKDMTKTWKRRLFSCETCGKTFKGKSVFEIHLRIHTGVKPFSCKSCGKSFRQAAHLSSHESIACKSVETQTNKKIFPCDQCSKVFMYSHVLKRHLRTHSGEKPYICDKCGKRFSQISHLSMHKKVVCGDVAQPELECLVCKRRFSYKQSLKIHMRRHTGEKPFSCSICGRLFRQSGNLNIHMKGIHGSKAKLAESILCNTCGKICSGKDAYSRHAKTHTKQRRSLAKTKRKGKVKDENMETSSLFKSEMILSESNHDGQLIESEPGFYHDGFWNVIKKDEELNRILSSVITGIGDREESHDKLIIQDSAIGLEPCSNQAPSMSFPSRLENENISRRCDTYIVILQADATSSELSWQVISNEDDDISHSTEILYSEDNIPLVKTGGNERQKDTGGKYTKDIGCTTITETLCGDKLGMKHPSVSEDTVIVSSAKNIMESSSKRSLPVINVCESFIGNNVETCCSKEVLSGTDCSVTNESTSNADTDFVNHVVDSDRNQTNSASYQNNSPSPQDNSDIPQVDSDISQDNSDIPQVNSDILQDNSDIPQVNSDIPQVNSDGLQVNSDGLQVNSDGLQDNLCVLDPDGSEDIENIIVISDESNLPSSISGTCLNNDVVFVNQKVLDFSPVDGRQLLSLLGDRCSMSETQEQSHKKSTNIDDGLNNILEKQQRFCVKLTNSVDGQDKCRGLDILANAAEIEQASKVCVTVYVKNENGDIEIPRGTVVKNIIQQVAKQFISSTPEEKRDMELDSDYNSMHGDFVEECGLHSVNDELPIIKIEIIDGDYISESDPKNISNSPDTLITQDVRHGYRKVVSDSITTVNDLQKVSLSGECDVHKNNTEGNDIVQYVDPSQDDEPEDNIYPNIDVQQSVFDDPNITKQVLDVLFNTSTFDAQKTCPMNYCIQATPSSVELADNRIQTFSIELIPSPNNQVNSDEVLETTDTKSPSLRDVLHEKLKFSHKPIKCEMGVVMMESSASKSPTETCLKTEENIHCELCNTMEVTPLIPVTETTCDICNKLCFCKHALTVHQKIHLDREACEDSFAQNSVLTLRQKVLSDVILHRCPTCSKLFTDPDQLNLHLCKHHNSEMNPVVIKSVLRNTISKGISHKCEQDSASDDTTHHVGPARANQKSFSCSVCSLVFKSRDELELHKRVHETKKLTPCVVCGKEFQLPIECAYHMRTHYRVVGAGNNMSSVSVVRSLKADDLEHVHVLQNMNSNNSDILENNVSKSVQSENSGQQATDVGKVKSENLENLGSHDNENLETFKKLNENAQSHSEIIEPCEVEINVQTVQKVNTNDIEIVENCQRVSKNGVDLVKNGHKVNTNGVEVVENGHKVNTNGVEVVENGLKVNKNGVELVKNDQKVNTNGVELVDLEDAMDKNTTDSQMKDSKERKSNFNDNLNLNYKDVERVTKPQNDFKTKEELTLKCNVTQNIKKDAKATSVNNEIETCLDDLQKESYPCSKCSKVFEYKHVLKRHLLQHEGFKAFCCEKCGKRFFQASHLRSHMSRHYREKHRCLVCKKAFLSDSQLKDHTSQLSCKKEMKISKNLSDINVQKKHECSVCSKVFQSSCILKRHTLIHMGMKPFECIVCGKRFRQKSHLAEHGLLHRDVEKVICETCGKSFVHKKSLIAHQRIHTDTRLFVCPVCQKRFKQSAHLASHALTHTGKRPHVCDVCGKSFTTKSSLQVHSTVHTNVRPFSCCECGKSFQQASGLKTHQRTHNPVKSFRCDVCDKLYSHAHVLRRHQLTHKNVKPYQCQTCQKSFSQSSHLKVHERIHSNEKLYECSVCQRRFNTPGAVQSHLMTHLNEKPFVCGECGNTFCSAGSLKQHVRKHVESYACGTCGKIFTTLYILHKHKCNNL